MPDLNAEWIRLQEVVRSIAAQRSSEFAWLHHGANGYQGCLCFQDVGASFQPSLYSNNSLHRIHFGNRPTKHPNEIPITLFQPILWQLTFRTNNEVPLWSIEELNLELSTDALAETIIENLVSYDEERIEEPDQWS